MSAVKDVADAKVVDFCKLKSFDDLKSMFPSYKGSEFLVTPIDRSMEFSTKEVTLYNTAWLVRHHSEDVW